MFVETKKLLTKLLKCISIIKLVLYIGNAMFKSSFTESELL